MTLTANTTLPDTLREVLRTQAPQAALLISVDQQALSLSATSPALSVSDLTPPDEWFESGELSWLTRDGALLGLLWSPTEVRGETVQMLTLLLAASRSDGALREADVLMTQLPEGVAWLSDDLIFVQISRRFLELHRLSAGQVIGHAFEEVFPGRQIAAERLRQALSGRSVSQECERLVTAGQATWLRSQMRPYYGSAAAGVLWTMQDITQEVALTARVRALLHGARLPTAVLGAGGEVLERSQSLRQSLQGSPDPQHAPLWAWPIWQDAEAAEQQLKRAVSQALACPQQRFECRLRMQGGEYACVSLSWSEELEYEGEQTDQVGPLLIAEFRFDERLGTQHAHNSLLAKLIAHSPQATLLLGAADDSGERPMWLASEAAARLLGVPPQALNVPGGAALGALLKSLGVQLSRPDLSPLSPVALTTQASSEGGDLSAVLTRPDGSRRHLQITAARLVSGEEAQPETGRQGEPLALYLHDVTTVRSLENRLKHNAGHDALTGLPNWPELRGRLGAASDPGSRNEGTNLSVIAFCIDEFGVLQAALGRSAGDHLLIQVAARLHHWRVDVQVARLEGEQFALVTGLLTPAEALTLAREAQELLSLPLRVGGREVLVSASVGVSCAQAHTGADLLLEQARTALLSARRSGRAGRQLFSPDLLSHEAGQLELEYELRGAVPEQFGLLFQPIVSFQTGRVQGAEVLLRWHHPTRGVLSPAQFLPLAARNGLLPELGRWVVAEVSAQRQRWQAIHPKLRLNFNLSAPELRDADFLAWLGEQLDRVSGLDLELGAGSLIGQDAGENMGEALSALRGAGARIWVDDFGDGASSLTALERFPLSGVKLHPSFVANLLDGPRPQALLSGTVNLARSLGLEVIAVGVETQAQAAALQAAGCHAAQGFLYAPPMALGEFERWLATQVLD